MWYVNGSEWWGNRLLEVGEKIAQEHKGYHADKEPELTEIYNDRDRYLTPDELEACEVWLWDRIEQVSIDDRTDEELKTDEALDRFDHYRKER